MLRHAHKFADEAAPSRLRDTCQLSRASYDSPRQTSRIPARYLFVKSWQRLVRSQDADLSFEAPCLRSNGVRFESFGQLLLENVYIIMSHPVPSHY